MIVLIHTSKTMRSSPSGSPATSAPVLLDKARELAAYVQTLTARQLSKVMALSAPLAAKTHELFASWNTDPDQQEPAVQSFLGDIYSGLQVGSFTAADRTHADRH